MAEADKRKKFTIRDSRSGEMRDFAYEPTTWEQVKEVVTEATGTRADIDERRRQWNKHRTK